VNNAIVADGTISMIHPPAPPDAPDPALRFRRRVQLDQVVRDLWHDRGLIRTLAERDLRARYKQTVLGFAWTFVTPVLMLIALTVFIQRVIKVQTNGVPYSIFSYLGLLPWGFFAASIGSGANSLIGNTALLNKLYCPREVFPLGSVIVAAFDTATNMLILVPLFIITGFYPKVTSYWVPVLLVVQVAFGLGVAFLVSSLVVFLRDLRHALPIIIQVGLFVTPIAYGLDAIPKAWRPLYSFVNPLGPVIDGYRRTVLLGHAPRLGLLGLAALSSGGMLALGYWTFKRLEPGIADVA
jgi:ABC-2 type transport system permease protein/lipopolysaccharide transport system permease protein